MIKQLGPLVLSLALFGASSASAADMPVKAPPKQFAAPFSWSGCYIGGHFGGGFGHTNVSEIPETPFNDDPNISTDTGSFLVGGQVGCNYQATNEWVLGVRGSISALTLKGETQFPDDSDFTVKGNWLASATGRLGYAWNPWLLYVEGGAAWINEKYEFVGPASAPDFRVSDTRNGWTFGVGLEYVFWGNWSADLRYAHYEFGTKNLTFVDSISGATTVNSAKQWFDAVTLGINYHFPGGSWQPAARNGNEDNDSQKETLAINGGVTYTQPYSIYGDFAVVYGPGGLDNSGIRFRAATVDGAYSFLQNGNFGPRQNGNSQEGIGQIGYEWVQGTTNILVATGVNYITGSSSTPANQTNTSNPVPGNAVGWKSLVELYSNPTDRTMIFAEGSYSTAFREYYTEFQAGYALFAPEIFIGPKVAILGDENFDQYRAGAFISGFKLGKVELGVSGGYLHDRQQGGGYFVGTDFYVRY